MENYHNFIHDHEQVKKFAQLFELKEKHLTMCVYLMARRKYYPSLSEISTVLARGMASGGTGFVDKFHKSIWKFGTAIGTYDDTDSIIPTDACVIYALIQPKNTYTALSATMTKCLENFPSENGEYNNAYNIFRIELGKDKSVKSDYRQLDIDTKNIENIKALNDLFTSINFCPIVTVETRGGFHMIYSSKCENSKEVNKGLYEFSRKTLFIKPNFDGAPTKDYWLSIRKECMCVVPGTVQGGFETRMISIGLWLLEQGVGY